MAQIKIRKYQPGGSVKSDEHSFGTFTLDGDVYNIDQVEKAMSRMSENEKRYVWDIYLKMKGGNNFSGNSVNKTIDGSFDTGLNDRQENRLKSNRTGLGMILDGTFSSPVNEAASSIATFIKNLLLEKNKTYSSTPSGGSVSGSWEYNPNTIKRLSKANGDRFVFDGTGSFVLNNPKNMGLFNVLDSYADYLATGKDKVNSTWITDLTEDQKNKLFAWYDALKSTGVEDPIEELKSRIRSWGRPITQEDTDLVDTLSLFGILPTKTAEDLTKDKINAEEEKKKAYEERIKKSIYRMNGDDFWSFFELGDDNKLILKDANGLRSLLKLKPNQAAIFNDQFRDLSGWSGLEGKWLIGDELVDENDIATAEDNSPYGIVRRNFANEMRKYRSDVADDVAKFKWNPEYVDPYKIFNSSEYYNPTLENKRVSSGGMFIKDGLKHYIVNYYDPTTAKYNSFGIFDDIPEQLIVDENGRIVKNVSINDGFAHDDISGGIYEILESTTTGFGNKFVDGKYLDLFPDGGGYGHEYSYLYNPYTDTIKLKGIGSNGETEVLRLNNFKRVFGLGASWSVEEIRALLKRIIEDPNANNQFLRYLRNNKDRLKNKVMSKIQNNIASINYDHSEDIEYNKRGGILHAAVGDSFRRATESSILNFGYESKEDDELKHIRSGNNYSNLSDIKKGGLTNADWWQIAGLAADCSALAASMFGATPAAAALSFAGTGSTFMGDITKDGFQGRDLKNLAINLGISAASLIPGLGMLNEGKIIKGIKNLSKVIVMAATAFGVGASSIAAVNKIANGEKWTLEDLRMALNCVVSLGHIAIGGSKNTLTKKKEVIEGAKIGKQKVTDETADLSILNLTPDEQANLSGKSLADQKTEINALLKGKTKQVTDSEAISIAKESANKGPTGWESDLSKRGFDKNVIDNVKALVGNNPSNDDLETAIKATIKTVGTRSYTPKEIENTINNVFKTRTRDVDIKYKLTEADVKKINDTDGLKGKRDAIVNILTKNGVEEAAAKAYADQAIIEIKDTSWKRALGDLKRRKANKKGSDIKYPDWADGYLETNDTYSKRLWDWPAQVFAYDRTNNGVFPDNAYPRLNGEFWGVPKSWYANHIVSGNVAKSGVDTTKKKLILQPYYYQGDLTEDDE